MLQISKPFLTGLALLIFLSGCGSDNASSETGQTYAATPTLAELPDCGQIANALDGFLDSWTAASDNGPMDNGPVYGVNCTWLSPKALSDNPFENIQSGALTIAITVSPMTQSETDAKSIGWVVEDDAVHAIGGYLVFPMGALEFDQPLGIIAPQVVVNKTTVAVATTGIYLSPSDESSAITNRHAVDAAISVHQMMQ